MHRKNARYTLHYRTILLRFLLVVLVWCPNVVSFGQGSDMPKWDWEKPGNYGAYDRDGQQISLRVRPQGLSFQVGGMAEYFIQAAGGSRGLMTRLMRGETLSLEPVSGHSISTLRGPLRLSLSGALDIRSPKTTEMVEVSVRAVSDDRKINADVTLTYSELQSEFTLVSYNVENLFDQKDDERNSSYADYRIHSNSFGKYSNYGDSVIFKGIRQNFTAVKIRGIRKALTAIDPAGPEIVAMQEVESLAVTKQLRLALADLGYTDAAFTDVPAAMGEIAVGQAILSKFPIVETKLIPLPQEGGTSGPGHQIQRPILRVALNIQGHTLYVYNDHWKSKASPESSRVASARALVADIKSLLASSPRADYIVVGDLNSDYNEDVVITREHNDTGGITGINQILKAQGDEVLAAENHNGDLHYDLFYELNRKERRSAYHDGFGWSTLDHIIIGGNLYDHLGISYMDNSFQVATSNMPRLKMLFDSQGLTNRWRTRRLGPDYTEHQVGGYSDHAPVAARFQIWQKQSTDPIELYRPGVPDFTARQ